MNIFVLDDHRRLIDLPGYGFAKAPLAAKLKWQQTIDDYMNEREALKGLIIVMDIRHPLKNLDVQLLEYCDAARIACAHSIKQVRQAQQKCCCNLVLKQVKAALMDYRNSVTFQVFSALKGTGLKELYAVLDEWYEYKKE